MSGSYLRAAESTLELANSAESRWNHKSAAERVELLNKLLWNPRITSKTLEYERRKPVAVLVKMKQEKDWGG